MRRLCLLAAGFAIAASGWADTITMKDGRVFAGTYLGGTARQIRLDLGPEVRTFDISEVARIDFTTTESAPPMPPPADRDRPVLRRAPAPPDDAVLRPDPAQVSQPPASVQLPAGTNIVVRLIDPVDSQTATQGQSFGASLDQPVEVNGQTVIPRGASAILRLVEAQQSGTFTGRTELALALISVKVNDRLVKVNTQTVTRVSDPRGEQTARVVGGAAAVGAIIGAIAGGGKGAAIGAGAGGAAGAGAQAVTRGQKIKIPSETRLTFVLENPVTI